MRKLWIGLFGILTSITVSVHADSYCEEDDLVVEKDFPFPQDESIFPETTLPEDKSNSPSSSSTPQPSRTEKDIFPDSNSNQPQTDKDIFPPDSQ